MDWVAAFRARFAADDCILLKDRSGKAANRCGSGLFETAHVAGCKPPARSAILLNQGGKSINRPSTHSLDSEV